MSSVNCQSFCSDLNVVNQQTRAIFLSKATQLSEWVIKFNGLLGTVDIDVHIVHTSHVIIAYTLETLSSFTQITHNLQVTINFDTRPQPMRKGITYWPSLTAHNFTQPFMKMKPQSCWEQVPITWTKLHFQLTKLHLPKHFTQKLQWSKANIGNCLQSKKNIRRKRYKKQYYKDKIREINISGTVYPKNYSHGSWHLVFRCGLVSINLTHIIQGHCTGNATMIRLS